MGVSSCWPLEGLIVFGASSLEMISGRIGSIFRGGGLVTTVFVSVLDLNVGSVDLLLFHRMILVIRGCQRLASSGVVVDGTTWSSSCIPLVDPPFSSCRFCVFPPVRFLALQFVGQQSAEQECCCPCS